MKNYEMKQKKVYRKTEIICNVVNTDSVLEKMASSYTKMPENTPKEYGIDNCGCPSCGCVRANLALILSPAGVATAVTIFAGTSAIN